MSEGMIFAIEEFTVHDGPGIRKTVFFKGCPLRCIWCHNPEGLSFQREIMVSTGACIRCGRCRDACSEERCSAACGEESYRAVSSEEKSRVAFNEEKCVVCGKCINICPLHLRRICGMKYEAKDLAAELLKGREILESSNGGITISGGEPLAQPVFLLELIKALKPVNIAVETSGYAPEAIFKEVVEAADLILMDVKHTDPEIHKLVTGVDNSLILNNLGVLCSSGKEFYVRIPLIPGITDTEENMSKTAELLKNAKGLVRVELLPYHKTAGAKYPMLGRKYNPGFDIDAKVNVYHGPFEKFGIRSVVL